MQCTESFGINLCPFPYRSCLIVCSIQLNLLPVLYLSFAPFFTITKITFQGLRRSTRRVKSHRFVREHNNTLYVDDVTIWLRRYSYDRGHMTMCLLRIVPIASIPGSILRARERIERSCRWYAKRLVSSLCHALLFFPL